jgi:hypothetical protein
MKANYYQIIKHCVETGCSLGVSRAYKHTEDPAFDHIETCVYDAIMIELTDKFNFSPSDETYVYSEL